MNYMYTQLSSIYIIYVYISSTHKMDSLGIILFVYMCIYQVNKTYNYGLSHNLRTMHYITFTP